MPTFDVINPTVQAAIIGAATEIAKAMYKAEAVNAHKIAAHAKELVEHLNRIDEPK